MSQYDFGTINPDSTSGSQLAVLLGNFRSALNSLHSGTSRPSYVTTGMLWLKTGSNPYPVYLYDGANDVLLGHLDATNHLWLPVIGGGYGSIASAGTTDLGTKTEGYLSITGTTTITSFGSSAPVGAIKILKFADILTLTHSSNLNIPGSASLTTAANDRAIVIQTASGVWDVMLYQRGNGTVIGLGTASTKNVGTAVGEVLMLDAQARIPAVNASLLTNLSAANLSSGAIPLARMPNGACVAFKDTSELGTAYATPTAGTTYTWINNPSLPPVYGVHSSWNESIALTHTALNANNRLEFMYKFTGYGNWEQGSSTFALFRDAETTPLDFSVMLDVGYSHTISLFFTVTAGDVSEHTYRIRAFGGHSAYGALSHPSYMWRRFMTLKEFVRV